MTDIAKMKKNLLNVVLFLNGLVVLLYGTKRFSEAAVIRGKADAFEADRQKFNHWHNNLFAK